eukprot:359472-Chlamydomonas_euryale.AAC.14
MCVHATYSAWAPWHDHSGNVYHQTIENLIPAYWQDRQKQVSPSGCCGTVGHARPVGAQAWKARTACSTPAHTCSSGTRTSASACSATKSSAADRLCAAPCCVQEAVAGTARAHEEHCVATDREVKV